jgi:hypothetical protein
LDIHFDLYDHVLAGNHIQYVKAPFSHDAQAGVVPEPSSLVLLGLGAGGLVGLGWRRSRRKKV